MNPWLIVVIAGLMETGWALGLKYSEGFTKLVPSVITIVLALGSFYLLSVAMKSLPVGTAYAVWVGIGAALTVAYGMATGAEPVTAQKVLLMFGLIGCVVRLKLAH